MHQPTKLLQTSPSLVVNLKEWGVRKVAVAGMCERKNLKSEIPALNKKLQSMCQQFNFDYIDNSNIYYKHDLSYDKIHLNYQGVEILESNFIDYLSNVEFEG